MLYDPRRENKKTKQEIFKLDNLIAWLETKDPDEVFFYTIPSECLLCQYFQEMGLDCFGVLPTGYFETTECNGLRPYPKVFDRIAVDANGSFGNALKLAKKKEAQRWSWRWIQNIAGR